jgi:hypothetical protein
VTTNTIDSSHTDEKIYMRAGWGRSKAKEDAHDVQTHPHLVQVIAAVPHLVVAQKKRLNDEILVGGIL